MAAKPIVLVTRKLPDSVEDRLTQDYDVRLNPDDALYSPDNLIELAREVDAILPCHTEHFTSNVVLRLPDSVKIVANFSVGVDHCNLEAFRKRGIIVTNTPDVLSDVLSLNCPATPETINLLSAERIARLPNGAIIVNTARGALVDEAALADALTSGKLTSAGLDVYHTEPGGNRDISALPNTFLLPHIGSANMETRDAMGFRALDNLDAFFMGREPKDRVA